MSCRDQTTSIWSHVAKMFGLDLEAENRKREYRPCALGDTGQEARFGKCLSLDLIPPTPRSPSL